MPYRKQSEMLRLSDATRVRSHNILDPCCGEFYGEVQQHFLGEKFSERDASIHQAPPRPV